MKHEGQVQCSSQTKHSCGMCKPGEGASLWVQISVQQIFMCQVGAMNPNVHKLTSNIYDYGDFETYCL
jgi:hypothetical protein